MADQALYPVSDTELGKATKLQYPGKYDSLGDDVVGRAMKQAHPEYRKPFRSEAEFKSNLKGMSTRDPRELPEAPLQDVSGDVYALGTGLAEVPAMVKAAPTIGKVGIAAAKGLGKGLSRPASKRGAAIGGTIGGAAGYKVAHYPGALIGAGAGATVGGELGNIGPALKSAVQAAKVRMRQLELPPRAAPAWKSLETESSVLPEVNPIKQTRTPSGRSVTKPPAIVAGPNKPSPPATRQPIWKGLTDKPVTPKPSPKAELKPPDITPSEAAPRFEPNAAKREAIARNATLARVLHEGGITAKQAESEMDSEHWKFLAEQLGLKVPAKGQVPEILKQLERLEQAAPIPTKPPIPSPAHRLNPPEGPGG